jgi:hypothetical protein
LATLTVDGSSERQTARAARTPSELSVRGVSAWSLPIAGAAAKSVMAGYPGGRGTVARSRRGNRIARGPLVTHDL